MTYHPVIILVHGILSSEEALTSLRYYAEQHGYQALTINYPSLHLTIEESAEHVYNCLSHALGTKEPFHMVGHSLGGILIRTIAHKYPALVAQRRLQRVVMLGTPNQGSALAEIIVKSRIGHRLFGPALLQLTPQAELLTRTLGRVLFPLGILAGNRSINPLSKLVFSGEPNDGAVAVKATKVAGMHDWLELPTHHSGLHTNLEAQRQTIFFLKHGYFDRT